MELGQRIKQARLEAGLSQRQLCGDTITRNMLSQIENGSAQPSMTTLRILAQRLGKPIGYFLEEELPSEQALLVKALEASPEEALGFLKEYPGSDPAWESIYRQLLAKCHLELAEKALEDGKRVYALTLLEKAAQSGTGDAFWRQYALLAFRAAPEKATTFAGLLPSLDDELLLLAQAAFDGGNAQKCLALLQAADACSAAHQLLEGKALFALQRYLPAAEALEELELTPEICVLLEQCYKELRDFEKAYYYACKQR